MRAKMCLCLLVLSGVAVTLLPGQDARPASQQALVPQGPERALMKAAGGGAQKVSAAGSNETYLATHVEFDNATHCEAASKMLHENYPADVIVLPPYKQFFDCLLRIKDAQGNDRVKEASTAFIALQRAPGFFWVDVDGRTEIPPPPIVRPSPEKPRGPAEEIVSGPITVAGEKLDGSGVIVAIVDSGIDFWNRDFQTENGQTRLLYFWDMLTSRPTEKGVPGTAQDAPLSLGTDRPQGVLYRQDEINAILKKRLPIPGDLGGHGTGCATVAAGNNRMGKHAGVAPAADLIAVRVGGKDRDDRGLSYAWLLPEIYSWLDEVGKQTGKAVVVSCSFGGHYGGHDGNRVEERQLNEHLASETPGRALCIAAGNERQDPIHGELVLNKGESGALRWYSAPPPPLQGPYELEIYFNTNNVQALSYNTRAAKVFPEFKVAYAKQAAENCRIHRPSGRAMTKVELEPGRGGLWINNEGPDTLEVDAYFPHVQVGEFLMPNAARRKLVGTPGTIASAITVGSYDWNPFVDGQPKSVFDGFSFRTPKVGKLSGYSSPGPSRAVGTAGYRKPDVVSPGQWYTVAEPMDVQRLDAAPHFSGFNGTSAATPYTAGVIALMFQLNPRLTQGQIKALFRKHCQAHADAATGDLPNDEWGNGKLSKNVVLEILDEVKATKPKD